MNNFISWLQGFSLVMADININETLYRVVGAFAAFAGGFAALALLYAGYLWMFAGDNVQQEAKARHAVGAAIVGTILCIGAVTLARLVTSNIVQQVAR
jgi:hypothetical protein